MPVRTLALSEDVADLARSPAPFVIAAERVVTGAGGVVHPAAAVVIGEGRILAVGPVSQVLASVGEGTPWIDLPGCTILPGLIDSHVHLTFSAGPFIARDLLADDQTALLLRGVVNARQALMAGVTTVRDLGSSGDVALRLRDAVARGLVPGPRILASGRPITIPDGHLHYLGGVANGMVEILALTEELIGQGVDVVKIIATGGNSTPTSDPLEPAFTLEEVRAIVDAAHRAGLPVTAHARGVKGIALLAESGIDQIEHCRMEVAPGTWRFDEALARRLAESGVSAAPTLAASFRALQRQAAGDEVGVRAGAIPIPIRQENARLLREAGVRVVVGTDAGACLARFDEAVHLELELLVEAGWSPVEAIEAGTLGAASAIRRADELGSIEAGKLADVLVVRGDPTVDISSVREVEQVYLGGRPVMLNGNLSCDRRPTPWPWPRSEIR
ncbi:MAG: amidohydrolase family protein [Chloroflexi bacterium]|nr:amidohydrolase family protein [Chloroflexota bacterium]